MLFNNDLCEVISDMNIGGYTIPTKLTDTALYRYISNPRSVEYNSLADIKQFAKFAMGDAAFMKYICLSKDVARWFKDVLEHHVYPDWKEDPGAETDTLIRLALVLDDREALEYYMNYGTSAYKPDVLFAFATIDQLMWIISII